MKKVVISIILVLILASCKKAENVETDKNQAELKETYDVNFNMVVPKDDVFQLYYTVDGTIVFGDDRSVKSLIKGSDKPQDVLFKLPVDVLPTQIRLDFGENSEQGNIVINTMKLKYLNKSYEKTFSETERLSHYFYPLDTQVKFHDDTHTVELLHPKGLLNDPLMWTNQLLSEEMVKLYKK